MQSSQAKLDQSFNFLKYLSVFESLPNQSTGLLPWRKDFIASLEVSSGDSCMPSTVARPQWALNWVRAALLFLSYSVEDAGISGLASPLASPSGDL